MNNGIGDDVLWCLETLTSLGVNITENVPQHEKLQQSQKGLDL